jgi:1-acyl-sn-glycerol-3-phosphate acyltransferase
MTTGLRFFYRHIFVTGLENIPSKGPVIIIANHNSSLMDAALLGILLKRPAWFFARGDVFVNKFIQYILWWFHMMPVHTYQGGRNTLSANNNSFSEGQKILSKGGIIVFFPESTSHVEHQLLPFRKGVFRLAFDTAAANNFSFDIPVVPVGISYDHPKACRTNAQVHAGKPLLLSSYKDEYNLNPAAALLHICKDAYKSIYELVLHVADASRLLTAEQHFIINRNNKPVIDSAWKIASADKLSIEQNICATINNVAGTDFENKEKSANHYFNTLSDAGLSDKTMAGNFSFSVLKKIRLLSGFPFYIIGLLLNGLPVLIARRIADKKVYRKDFYTWIFVACYSFIYFFWLIIILVSSLFFGWKYTLGLLITMIVTGIFAYVYKDWLTDYNQHKKLQLLTSESAKKLATLRQAIQSRIY